MKDVDPAYGKLERDYSCHNRLRHEVKRVLLVSEVLPVDKREVSRADRRPDMTCLQLSGVNSAALEGLINVVCQLRIETMCSRCRHFGLPLSLCHYQTAGT